MLTAINKTSRQHERDRRGPETLFKGTIARPIDTHDVEHLPSLSLRDWPGFGCTRRTRLRLTGEGQGQRVAVECQRRKQFLPSVRTRQLLKRVLWNKSVRAPNACHISKLFTGASYEQRNLSRWMCMRGHPL